jgi:alkylation response protein AidB-like acyl-CoA dehydrogenase
MDFSLPYTQEQEQFRRDVRLWLEDNIPNDMRQPTDTRDFTDEQYWWWREKNKEIAAKGWLYPTYPKEYGGGGLAGDYETIIEEEFLRARVPRGGFTPAHVFPTLLVWATEEQKQKFLVPLLTAEKVAWQKWTEPQSGADLANYQSHAVRDGDDWVLSGQNVFISGKGNSPDWLYGPMVTDPDAPRHRNLGYFMIPNPTPGLEIREQNLLVGHDQHFIFLDNVRVPGDHLIGGDHQGWQVASTSLESEHGGRGKAFPTDDEMGNLISYVTQTAGAQGTLGKDPVVQQTTMDAHLEAHVDSLLSKRTFWMYQNRMELTYEGNLANTHNREYTVRTSERVRRAMGMYALLGTQDHLAPHGGAQEVSQRSRAGQNHAGGSTNIAKVVLARRIGISRTKERAAPTPSTATSYGS